MTLPRLEALQSFWDTMPSLAQSVNEIRVILRSYFKVTDSPKSKRMTEHQQTEAEFRAKFEQLSTFMN